MTNEEDIKALEAHKHKPVSRDKFIDVFMEALKYPDNLEAALVDMKSRHQ